MEANQFRVLVGVLQLDHGLQKLSVGGRPSTTLRRQTAAFCIWLATVQVVGPAMSREGLDPSAMLQLL
jgi:hypothetical protein